MKIPNVAVHAVSAELSLARIVSEDSQPVPAIAAEIFKSSKDS